ncbi:hypothetical protein CSUI_001444 [Cystoisospora suis]|uniref:Transmembrane protein n=1 Tax=Cystoisospora suis TaxID=483139 RepID=A0A2C6KKX8_9APIC|nr:hypothetical protein CSUI_001444 [Cystoisospora suis]
MCLISILFLLFHLLILSLHSFSLSLAPRQPFSFASSCHTKSRDASNSSHVYHSSTYQLIYLCPIYLSMYLSISLSLSYLSISVLSIYLCPIYLSIYLSI